MVKYLADSVVAMVTPFKKDFSIDYASVESLVNYQVTNGTSAIVVCGTTGESPTLSFQEKTDLFLAVKNYTKGNLPLVLGTGTNCTATSVELTKQAEKIGADGVLVVCPYYNKPSQRGLYSHFATIAKSTSLPIYLYNVPGRTGSNLDLETIYKLAEIPNIVGLKDAVADLSRVFKIRNTLGDKFILLSGEDETFLSYIASGGNGCISVSANIIPKQCANIHNLFRSGNIFKAIQEQTHLINLHSAMFCESNPVPVKHALYISGIISTNAVRLPLEQLESNNAKLIEAVLQSCT